MLLINQDRSEHALKFLKTNILVEQSNILQNLQVRVLSLGTLKVKDCCFYSVGVHHECDVHQTVHCENSN